MATRLANAEVYVSNRAVSYKQVRQGLQTRYFLENKIGNRVTHLRRLGRQIERLSTLA